MKLRILNTVVASLGLVGALAVAPLAIAGSLHESRPTQFLGHGNVHEGGPTDRTIVIDGKTKWVNVKDGEVVRFVVGEKSFAWLFDRYDQGADLGKMAPKDVLGGRSIKVYVETPPPQ